MSLDKIAATVRKLHETVMSGGINFKRVPAETIKRPVDPSSRTEPIEDTEARAGGDPQGAKPPFEAMVKAAASALLNGKDPHEAVEKLLGEGEPEDETEVIRAVEAAIATLDIEEKEDGGETPESEV
jgi:hypothetical protein